MEGDAVWSGTQALTRVKAAESSKPFYNLQHLKEHGTLRVYPHSQHFEQPAFQAGFCSVYVVLLILSTYGSLVSPVSVVTGPHYR
jgi:hypothetical protein